MHIERELWKANWNHNFLFFWFSGNRTLKKLNNTIYIIAVHRRHQQQQKILAFTWFFEHKIICTLHKLFITAIIVGFCSSLVHRFFGRSVRALCHKLLPYRTKWTLFYVRWLAKVIHPIFNYVCALLLPFRCIGGVCGSETSIEQHALRVKMGWFRISCRMLHVHALSL